MIPNKEAARTVVGLVLAKINDDEDGYSALLAPYRDDPASLDRIIENLANLTSAAVRHSEGKSKPLTEKLLRTLASKVVGLDDLSES